MRRDSAAPGAELGKQMRQFVPQGTINLRCAVVGQPAVE
jgi:hypothetical protein